MQKIPNKLDWLGLGTAKCGTTAFYRLLGQHPKIDAPWGKELQYFERLNLSSEDAFHKKHFKHIGDPEYRSGEMTPSYIYFTNCLPRIKKYNPNIKMFWMVRDPLEYLVSSRFYQFKSSPIEDIMAAKPIWAGLPDGRLTLPQHYTHMLGRACYGTQMEHYLRHFPREQLMILKNTNLRGENMQPTMDKVTDFLGLDKAVFKNDNWNPTKYTHTPEQITAMYGPNTRKTCRELFIPELEKFEKLSGINCSEWKKRLTSI